MAEHTKQVQSYRNDLKDSRRNKNIASENLSHKKRTAKSPSKKYDKSRRKQRTNSENSSSSCPDDRRRRLSKKLSRKRSHSSSTDTSSNKSDVDHKKKKRTRSKDRMKKKKAKKKKKKKSHSAVNQHKYGKYGILAESDMFAKQQEFYLWLMEVKTTNPETLPRFEMKKMFETFMEDYNTATLPHKKFYDLERWESKQHQKGKLRAMKEAVENPKVAFGDDEERHKSLHKTGKGHVLSRAELLDMQKVLRSRREDEYRKNAGLKID